jgi:PTS system sucrose-specific IIC component
MKGDGFQLFVKMGDKVKAGQKLLTFDIEKIKAAGYSPTTAVLVANSAAYKACNILKIGNGNEMDRLIEIV